MLKQKGGRYVLKHMTYACWHVPKRNITCLNNTNNNKKIKLFISKLTPHNQG